MAYEYVGGCPMLGYGGSGVFGGVFGMVIGTIIWVLIIAGIVFLAIWLMKNYNGQHNNQQKSGRQSDETPMGILRRRYAEGDITKREFEEMKKELHNK